MIKKKLFKPEDYSLIDIKYYFKKPKKRINNNNNNLVL